MSEEKTYVFDSGSNMVASLAPLLKNNGIDPSVLYAMNNNGMGGMNGGGWFIWILFLAFIWNRNGFGGNGDGTGFLASQLNNDYGRDVLLQAINGVSGSVNQLASTLNCDIGVVQSAIATLGSQIQSVGNSVGLSGQQIINAIQSGNASIASQLASCCCDVKTAIATQGYENRLATLDQTQTLAGKIDAQTAIINDKFCQLEMREMQNKIDALRDEKLALQTNISQRAQNEYIASSLYPISTALTELRADFDCFKSHLPETVSVQKNNGVYVPYSPFTAVPNCIAYQYGIGQYGAPNGSLWG